MDEPVREIQDFIEMLEPPQFDRIVVRSLSIFHSAVDVAYQASEMPLLAGWPVYTDPELPADIIELRRNNGSVFKTIRVNIETDEEFLSRLIQHIEEQGSVKMVAIDQRDLRRLVKIAVTRS